MQCYGYYGKNATLQQIDECLVSLWNINRNFKYRSFRHFRWLKSCKKNYFLGKCPLFWFSCLVRIKISSFWLKFRSHLKTSCAKTKVSTVFSEFDWVFVRNFGMILVQILKLSSKIAFFFYKFEAAIKFICHNFAWVKTFRTFFARCNWFNFFGKTSWNFSNHRTTETFWRSSQIFLYSFGKHQ